MTDHELSSLLQEWKRTPAPPSLNARVLGPRRLPPSSWWDGIPGSLISVAGAVAGVVGVWLLITLAPKQSTPVPATVAPQAHVEQATPAVPPPTVAVPVEKKLKPVLPRAFSVGGLPPAARPPKPTLAKKPLTVQTAENLTTAAPKLLNGPIPTYPADAPPLAFATTLKLRIRIGKDGRVLDAAVIDGDPLLSSVAIEAVKAWLYEPNIVNGEPAEATIETDVVFEPIRKKK